MAVVDTFLLLQLYLGVCFQGVLCCNGGEGVAADSWCLKATGHISTAHRMQREQTGNGARLQTLKFYPSDLLPTVRLQILKVPSPPLTVPLTGNQLFKYLSQWGIFLIQTTSMAIYEEGHADWAGITNEHV